MSIISVPSFEEENGAIVYQIHTQLPLRLIRASRRYSEFDNLVSSLSKELGILKSDFPYELPPKGGLLANKLSVATMRKELLAKFLNALVRDRDLQNRSLVRDFLSLPPNAKLTADLFRSGDSNVGAGEKFSIHDKVAEIRPEAWLDYMRKVRASVEGLVDSLDPKVKQANRKKISTYIRPNIEKLAQSLKMLVASGALSPQEVTRRKNDIATLQSKINAVYSDNLSTNPKDIVNSRRQFFSGPANAEETTETVGFTNEDLLQHQKQIHKDQDAEVDEILKIVIRQRQLAEAIDKEVEEQSEILDDLDSGIDNSNAKIQKGRERAKQFESSSSCCIQ